MFEANGRVCEPEGRTEHHDTFAELAEHLRTQFAQRLRRIDRHHRRDIRQAVFLSGLGRQLRSEGRSGTLFVGFQLFLEFLLVGEDQLELLGDVLHAVGSAEGLDALRVVAPVTGRLTSMDLKVGQNRNRGERFAEITPDTGFKLIMNGEIGRYENVRYVEQTNIAKGSGTDGVTQTPWTNAKSDWMFVFGNDTVFELAVANAAAAERGMAKVRAAMTKAAEELTPFEEAYAQTDWSRFEHVPMRQTVEAVATHPGIAPGLRHGIGRGLLGHARRRGLGGAQDHEVAQGSGRLPGFHGL